MKLFLFGLLVTLGACSSTDSKNESTKSEDCTMNFTEFNSPLDSTSKGFKRIEAENRNEAGKVLIQKAILRSGEQLDFSGGGCTHTTYSFTYSDLNDKAPEVNQQVDLALKLLKKTPSNHNVKAILMAALINAKKQPLKADAKDNVKLPCGDATCVLTSDGITELRISYDFAL